MFISLNEIGSTKKLSRYRGLFPPPSSLRGGGGWGNESARPQPPSGWNSVSAPKFPSPLPLIRWASSFEICRALPSKYRKTQTRTSEPEQIRKFDVKIEIRCVLRKYSEGWSSPPPPTFTNSIPQTSFFFREWGVSYARDHKGRLYTASWFYIKYTLYLLVFFFFIFYASPLLFTPILYYIQTPNNTSRLHIISYFSPSFFSLLLFALFFFRKAFKK